MDGWTDGMDGMDRWTRYDERGGKKSQASAAVVSLIKAKHLGWSRTFLHLLVRGTRPIAFLGSCLLLTFSLPRAGPSRRAITQGPPNRDFGLLPRRGRIELRL